MKIKRKRTLATTLVETLPPIGLVGFLATSILPALGKGIPIFGFYAWGELGRIQGDYAGMDHQYQQHTFVSNMIGIEK